MAKRMFWRRARLPQRLLAAFSRGSPRRKAWIGVRWGPGPPRLPVARGATSGSFIRLSRWRDFRGRSRRRCEGLWTGRGSEPISGRDDALAAAAILDRAVSITAGGAWSRSRTDHAQKREERRTRTCKSRRNPAACISLQFGCARQRVTGRDNQDLETRATNPHAAASMIRMSSTSFIGNSASQGGR